MGGTPLRFNMQNKQMDHTCTHANSWNYVLRSSRRVFLHEPEPKREAFLGKLRWSRALPVFAASWGSVYVYLFVHVGVFSKHWATFPDEILCRGIILMKMSFPFPSLSFCLSICQSDQPFSDKQPAARPRSSSPTFVHISPPSHYEWQTPHWRLYLSTAKKIRNAMSASLSRPSCSCCLKWIIITPPTYFLSLLYVAFALVSSISPDAYPFFLLQVLLQLSIAHTPVLVMNHCPAVKPYASAF